MNKKVIVIEGLPASGKTTLANYLRDHHGFNKVNESLGELGGINLTDDQKIIFQETLIKYRIARKSKIHSIIDRGYPSMLAWDYCAEKLTFSFNLKEKNEWVKKALIKRDLFEPDLYIYLMIKPSESLRRRPRVEGDQDVWTGLYGMKYCIQFYNRFFSVSKQRSKILKLNGSEPTIKLAEEIIERI